MASRTGKGMQRAGNEARPLILHQSSRAAPHAFGPKKHACHVNTSDAVDPPCALLARCCKSTARLNYNSRSIRLTNRNRESAGLQMRLAGLYPDPRSLWSRFAAPLRIRMLRSSILPTISRPPTRGLPPGTLPMKGALMPSRLPLVGLQICNKIVRTAAEWLARQKRSRLGRGKKTIFFPRNISTPLFQSHWFHVAWQRIWPSPPSLASAGGRSRDPSLYHLCCDGCD